MEILKNVVIVLYLLVCVALVILITKQSKEDAGSSGTIMGASASNFYEKNKGKTKEGKMKKLTIILAVVFVILTVALGVIYVI